MTSRTIERRIYLMIALLVTVFISTAFLYGVRQSFLQDRVRFELGSHARIIDDISGLWQALLELHRIPGIQAPGIQAPGIQAPGIQAPEGEQPKADGELAEAGIVPRALHLRRVAGVIERHVLHLRDEWDRFGAPALERPIERAGVKARALVESLRSTNRTDPRFRESIEVQIDTLALSLAQVHKAQVIENRTSQQRLLEQEERFAWITTLLGLFAAVIVVLLIRMFLRQISHAVSRLRASESELRALNEELEVRVEARTRELRSAQAELSRQERLATLGQLTATVSHELRNPLGTMRTSTHLVRKLAVGEDARLEEAVARLDRGITRCDRIIDELLDFTRISDPELQVFPLDDWLGRQLDELEVPEAVTLNREPGLPNIALPFDPDRLRRALVNVYDNACQALAENLAVGGTITVATRGQDGYVAITVTDNGPGIAPEALPRIFEPLFSTKNFGVGLGMAVVNQVLEQHGGKVEIDSAAGHGTEIRLLLPLETVRRGVVEAAKPDDLDKLDDQQSSREITR